MTKNHIGVEKHEAATPAAALKDAADKLHNSGSLAAALHIPDGQPNAELLQKQMD